MPRKRVHIHVDGAVQGVGFRPFVYRVAHDLGLGGWVCNNSTGVDVEFEGEEDAVELGLRRLKTEHPPHADISGVSVAFCDPLGDDGFAIRSSDDTGGTTSVLPDLATCEDCRREVFDSQDRRYRYPFTNCTNCGPRFSIIQEIPYDRATTTMRGFEMCAACQAEYDDPLDRRFHAQPNACPACGPKLHWRGARGKVLAERDDVLRAAEDAILEGDVVAVKGLGGFHLVVDATSETAVGNLRQRKQRGKRPFAVMFPSLYMVREVCEVSSVEADALLDAGSPIVLLDRRRDAPEDLLARAVAPDNPRIGVMLPYTPLHHLLLADLGRPVVVTSANRASEPICTNSAEAVQRLHRIADWFLDHDRPIARPVEDSVVQVVLGAPQVLRYARGHAPQVVAKRAVANFDSSEVVLAAGGHLKSAVALARDGEVILGPHVGNLDTVEALEAFEALFDDLAELQGVAPSVVAHDVHPDYQSTRVAQESGAETYTVQHHHAHVAAVMAEHDIDGEVLGVSWDGTGYGGDGTVWGGEFLRASRSGFERVAHLYPFRLPGGEAAAREPRRSALGVLSEAFDELPLDRVSALRAAFDSIELDTLAAMLRRNLRCVETTSAGRLFDAVASLLGLCQHNDFEAEAAMMLQFKAESVAEEPVFDAPLEGESIDWRPTIRQMVDALDAGESPAALARGFHLTLARAIVAVARRHDLPRVVLSGGCFQNRLLLTETASRLQDAGFDVYWPQRIPAGDGGLAVGQAIVASSRNT
jgi:hydrogenase maturation protein HypF